MINQDIVSYILANLVVRGDDECWEWGGQTVNAHGRDYGIYKLDSGKFLSVRQIVREVYTGIKYDKSNRIGLKCGNFLCYNPNHFISLYPPETERFLLKVDKRGPDECWPWLGYVNKSVKNPFGIFLLDNACQTTCGKMAYAVSNGIDVRDIGRTTHVCKNLLCCNPSHIKLKAARPEKELIRRKLMRELDGKECITESERFWSNVDRRSAEGCWEWVGAINQHGYGRYITSYGKLYLAHRFSYELNHGSIPIGLFVAHKCDNPSCVRPDHLFAATPKENTQDCISKGRHQHGNDHAHAKLTESDIIEIRKLLGLEYQKVIAEKFGVNQTAISCIKRGKTWSHVK